MELNELLMERKNVPLRLDEDDGMKERRRPRTLLRT